MTKRCVAMTWFLHEPIDVVTYCIRCSRGNKLGNTWIQGASHGRKAKKKPSLIYFEQSEMEAAFEKTLDPTAGSPAARKSVEQPIYLWMIFLEQVEKKMEQRVLTRLRKDFQNGSKDWNDAACTGQRIRWTQDSQNGPAH